jgi:hypothetical protein
MMDLQIAIDRIKATIDNLETQKRSAIQMGYIHEPVSLSERDKKNDMYYSLANELVFNKIILSAMEDKKETISWRNYLLYLHEWAQQHSDPLHRFFRGGSPAGYDEWLNNDCFDT